MSCAMLANAKTILFVVYLYKFILLLLFILYADIRLPFRSRMITRSDYKNINNIKVDSINNEEYRKKNGCVKKWHIVFNLQKNI